jgi:hypothetical protein
MKIRLAQNETVTVDPRRSTLKVTCESGCAWVTQSSDARDYILRNEDVARMARKGRVVLQALDADGATVCVLPMGR